MTKVLKDQIEEKTLTEVVHSQEGMEKKRFIKRRFRACMINV